MESRKELDTRLGRREVDMDKVIHFPRGIIGFEGRKHFTLLEIRPGAPFLVLQNMDDPGLGLLVADPYGFLPDYSLKLGDAEQKLLQMENRDDLAVLVTVAIPPGKPEETLLNLSGPILINHTAKIGVQVPQTDMKGPSRVTLRTADLKPVDK